MSTDPEDSARRNQPQSWNLYAYALNNPIRYVDSDGRTEREGWQAGVIVNSSTEEVWIAGDVDGKIVVIPLSPGESSATYMQDADAIVIDPGVISQEGATLAPSIEDESSGAFKVGASVVNIEDSGPMNLGLDRSSGYVGSWLIGRSGFVDAKEAQKQRWVIPKDRQAAERKKEELKHALGEREKRKKEEEKKKEQQSKSKSKKSV